MPIIQENKAYYKSLTTAQLDVLVRAYTIGSYGVKNKVSTNGIHFRTEMILREGGYIAKDYDIQDMTERVSIGQLLNDEIDQAVECIKENWNAAFEHMKKAKEYEHKLQRTAWWLTDKGKEAAMKGMR